MYIALAIKKVRLCPFVKGVEHSISTKMAKTNKEYKDTNAEIAVSDLYGHLICQEEISLAA